MGRRKEKIMKVMENRNVGTAGKPKMVEIVLFEGTADECARFEIEQRKEYVNEFGHDHGSFIDCYCVSDEKERKSNQGRELWESLTDEEKHDYIEIDGHKYVRKMYEKMEKKDEEETQRERTIPGRLGEKNPGTVRIEPPGIRREVRNQPENYRGVGIRLREPARVRSGAAGEGRGAGTGAVLCLLFPRIPRPLGYRFRGDVPERR